MVVECTGVSASPVSAPIRPNQLRSAPSLRHLTLRSCSLQGVPAGALSGLSGLSSLAVERGEEGAVGDLQPFTFGLRSDTLAGLTGLRNLDLSGNGFPELPRDLYCPTSNLRVLNLSSNGLEAVTAAGLTCPLLQLEILDLSFNQLTALLPGDLAAAPSLQQLYLQVWSTKDLNSRIQSQIIT